MRQRPVRAIAGRDSSRQKRLFTMARIELARKSLGNILRAAKKQGYFFAPS
jgi:hypothetical protein